MSPHPELGFARVSAATLPVHLGDPAANAAAVISAAQEADAAGAALVVFPELSLTGYSLDDLLIQRELLRATLDAVDVVAAASAGLSPILVVGAPLTVDDALFNCVVFIHRGRILGITPKTHLPNYREFYEKRYFSAAPADLQFVTWPRPGGDLTLRASSDPEGPTAIPFGQVHVVARDIPGFRLAAEICEDIWVPVPPSSLAALQGATVIANVSASPVTVGRARARAKLVGSHSSSTLTAYVYSAAGFGESSNDLSWDGQSLIYEAGVQLAQSHRFQFDGELVYADIDLQLLERERLQQNSYHDNALRLEGAYQSVAIVEVDVEVGDASAGTDRDLLRPVPQFPFVPQDLAQLDSDCHESFNIQVSALCRRIKSIGQPKLVIGVSGGLDSTLALLVAVRAMDRLGRDRADVLAYTMPGFGTSAGTRENAELLCRQLGVTFEELDIVPTATQMLQTMGHPFGAGVPTYDVTFENVQAGLRTDYLFRLANQLGGIVVGTGDLSELALGWCTYGVGDQMSHYAVNAGLPKTMIQHLIRWTSTNEDYGSDLRPVLDAILATEISPELIPADATGETQSTEAAIGPYELQDFTLFYMLRHGFSPAKIFYLQQVAWGDKYSDEELLHWLEVFYRRFFANQFKRTAIPNGPKIVGGGALSPRGDWRMPSDAVSTRWLDEVADLQRFVGAAQ